MARCKYCKTYANADFKFKVFSDTRKILKLVDDFLDFKSGTFNKKSKKTVVFYLHKTLPKKPKTNGDFIFKNVSAGKNFFIASFGPLYAAINVDYRKSIVRADISSFDESDAERVVDFIIVQPLRQIMAFNGLFFFHACAVANKKGVVLITGPQDSGKTTTGLALVGSGFRMLADDKCFIGFEKNKLKIMPLPTKIGLNRKSLKNNLEFSRHILKNYRLGEKCRFSSKILTLLTDKRFGGSINKNVCNAIVFPKYQTGRNVSIKPLPFEKAFNNILNNENMYRGTNIGSREFKILFSKNFMSLYKLARTTKSFELIYGKCGFKEISSHIVPAI